MLNRIRTHWTLLTLIALMGLQLWVGAIWILTDARVGDGVCCSFTAPVLDILLADATDQLGLPWSSYRRSMGLLVWPALWARKLVGPDPDFLLWLNLASGVLSQVLLYDLGRRLSSPFAGLVAAGLFPMIPAVAFVQRRWDALAPQHLVLLAALWLLIRSKNLTRPIDTGGFMLVAMAGCVLSARETDNLLFMAAIGAMTLGPVLRGLITGAGPGNAGGTAAPPGRARSFLGATVVAGVMAVFCVEYAFPLVDFGYFGDELGNQQYVQAGGRWSLAAFTAYPLRLYSDDLTPWLAVPLLLVLPAFLRRGPAKAELLGWLLLPLLALSFVGKKNFYYASVVYPVVPLLLGLGLASLEKARVRVSLGAALLLVSWLQFSARSLPTSTFPRSLGTLDWTGAVGPQQHLFQGIVPLNLAPRGPSEISRLLQMLEPEITAESCDCPQHLVIHGQGDFSEIHLSLKMTDPCLAMSPGTRVDHPDSVGLVLTTQAVCGEETPPTSVVPLKRVLERETGPTCAQLWRRMGRRLCGTVGSPPE